MSTDLDISSKVYFVAVLCFSRFFSLTKVTGGFSHSHKSPVLDYYLKIVMSDIDYTHFTYANKKPSPNTPLNKDYRKSRAQCRAGVAGVH